MDYLQKFIKQFRTRLGLLLLANSLLLSVAWWVADIHFQLDGYQLVLVVIGVPLLLVILLPFLTTRHFTRPTQLLWQAILHIAPHADQAVAAPDLDSVGFGRELITALATQIYQFATVADKVTHNLEEKDHDLHHNPIAGNLPLPLFILNKDLIITFVNGVGASYLDMDEKDIIGKDVYSVLDLSFQNNSTLDAWLSEVRQNAVTSVKAWERVRLNPIDTSHKASQFDLAAYYNQANPLGYEVMLVLFDHTQSYGADDQAMSLVAMAVHELRTPLTLLRGYIEAFGEDLDGRLPDIDAEYLHKMDAAGQQLVTFINNVLNVARIEDDQFLVNLHEESWPEIVEAAVRDMSLRASVQGIELETKVGSNLPTVGVDRVSIYEVISNLVDNAIKYSGDGKKITITARLTDDGVVETDVQDLGIGIPANLVANLFDKFYRSHRSRAQISGTGLGLYLCKTIVNAHGGNIWVRSAEGKGSIFSFTILPYERLAADIKGHPEDLTRTAHGWIKNHSLYRR